MRSRNRLHVSKLSEFVEFCQSKGWRSEDLKGVYEVSRMSNNGKQAIVYRKDKTLNGGQIVHLTLDNAANSMFTQFIKQGVK